MTTHDFKDGRGEVPAHQHLRGGGWVDDTAKVHESATVEEGATVGPSATVGRFATVGESATVGEFAIVGDSAIIGEDAIVGDSAIIGEYEIVGRDVTVGESATIGEGATVIKVPAIENIDAVILAAIREKGCTLEMDAYHQCATTHCRAGWAIHLAGEAGYTLENLVGAWEAGTAIYLKSRPKQAAPDFFASNDDALADLKSCAEKSYAEKWRSI